MLLQHQSGAEFCRLEIQNINTPLREITTASWKLHKNRFSIEKRNIQNNSTSPIFLYVIKLKTFENTFQCCKVFRLHVFNFCPWAYSGFATRTTNCLKYKDTQFFGSIIELKLSKICSSKSYLLYKHVRALK